MINNSADFDDLIESLDDTDHLEACRQERPSSKFVVDRITNTSFNIYPIPDHPIGDNTTKIPEFILNAKEVHALVHDSNEKNLLNDRKMLFFDVSPSSKGVRTQKS